MADELVSLVRQHLPRLAADADVDEADFVVVVPAEHDSRWKLPLDKLFGRVLDRPRAEWPSLVVEWIEQTKLELVVPEQQNAELDLLRVQVWPRGVRLWPGGIEQWLVWPYGEVFEVAVVLDHPSTVEFLSMDLVAAWGIPIDEINQRAIRQTISRELSDVAVKDHGWPQGHDFQRCARSSRTAST